jgi:threonine/homoserine/homoserine lactone efflux protein
MDTQLFLKGFLIGLSIAAPVGPIGILCIHRTLEKGWAIGFVTGLGAATADAVYAVIAGFGLIFISAQVVEAQMCFPLIGGCFLIYLGIMIFKSHPQNKSKTKIKSGLIGSYISAFLLTLANPATILSFLALFTALRTVFQLVEKTSVGFLIVGVFLGSAFWWLILSGVVGILRSKVGEAQFQWVNKISGTVLIGFGLFGLFNFGERFVN